MYIEWVWDKSRNKKAFRSLFMLFRHFFKQFFLPIVLNPAAALVSPPSFHSGEKLVAVRATAKRCIKEKRSIKVLTYFVTNYIKIINQCLFEYKDKYIKSWGDEVWPRSVCCGRLQEEKFAI